jgi:oligopeptide/dipeptide ABC transporter ATP-binding protein
MTFLNPIMKVGDQISERLTEHLHMTTGEAKTRAAELLAAVQIPLPARIIEYYPHQLSGGMRQRVLIAMAIACNPTLLIADEPTTALDTTVQAQIIKLMKELREKLNTTLLLITHDLGVVAEICDRVCVMYAGKIVEIGDVYTIFRNPMHPYTVGLLKSVLRVGKRRKTLLTIEGSVPDLTNPPNACRFHPRCSKALAVCREREPSMIEAEPRHYVNCWLYGRD